MAAETPPDGFVAYDETVPKDGSLVELWAPEWGPYRMRWHKGQVNPLVSHRPGIWVDEGGQFTWCDEREAGAPTHWRRVQ